MQFQRVAPECLVAKSVKTESLLSLLHLLYRVIDNRILNAAWRNNVLVADQTVGVGVPTYLLRGDVYYWGSLMAACLITSLPIGILYNLFLDRFIEGFTVGAVK